MLSGRARPSPANRLGCGHLWELSRAGSVCFVAVISDYCWIFFVPLVALRLPVRESAGGHAIGWGCQSCQRVWVVALVETGIEHLISLYSSVLSCLCFHQLYTSSFCKWSSLTEFLLSQGGLLVQLLVFLQQCRPCLCWEEAAPWDLPALHGCLQLQPAYQYCE